MVSESKVAKFLGQAKMENSYESSAVEGWQPRTFLQLETSE